MVLISNLLYLSEVRHKGAAKYEQYNRPERHKKETREKMTIGKNSRKSSLRSSIRAPKFLDKSNGFYGRLDEPEVTGEAEEERCNREEGVMVDKPGLDEREEVEMFNEGMMESDGETLLRRKPSRRSSRWRRSSRRKQKEEEKPVEGPADSGVVIQVEVKDLEKAEDVVVHFPVREDEDDQVLIRDKKRGREEAEEGDEEGEEERRVRKEQEEGMKAVKRHTVKNYRKVRTTS